ncbi:MAG: DUF502 domain-containing protein [Deltaproteobacteria bacterium]|nr:DUF502 domain-containing protein [Deltaproteobacteria bacterium]
MKKGFKGYFITGLLVVVPLYITVYVLSLIVGFMDNVFVILPEFLRPDTYLPFHVPGLGIFVTIFGIFIVGVLTTNFFGKRLLVIGEKVLSKVPVLRVVYNATKQFMETFFTDNQSFRKVVLIEFPRQGLYSIGFLTGKLSGELKSKTPDDSVSVFLPTTPNPTTGYYIMARESQIIPLEMKVEDAFKVIMTGGVVAPNNEEFKAAVSRHKGVDLGDLDKRDKINA